MFNWAFKHLHESDLNSLIAEANKFIFNGELTDIIEVTYAYKKLDDNTFLNTTLFSNFLWVNMQEILFIFLESPSEKITLLKKLWVQVYKKLEEKISTIDRYILWLNALKNLKEADIIKRDLMIWSLKYAKNTLEMALVWLPFELEKAWLQNELWIEQKLDRVQKIESLELENFWWKISENPEELVLAYEYLVTKFEENKSKLNKRQQEEYVFTYLAEIEKLLPEDYDTTTFKPKNLNTTNKPKTNVLEKKIHRSKYIPILKSIFEMLNLDFDVVVDERSSIYDWPSALHIPVSEKYDYLSVKRIIELIGHEIESHSTNLRTNEKIIWKFRSAWNLTKEEWLAMVVEKLLLGQNLDDIWVPQHFPKVLMAELFSWKPLQRFLELNNMLEPDVWNEWRLLRLKRNYPMDCRWWQHKDSTYGRGVLEVIKYIKEWNDVRDLYLWKVSISDIPKVKRLMELKWLTYDDLNLPLFIWELVLFIFEREDNNINSRRKQWLNQEEFMDYLKIKYPFIDFSKIEISVSTFFIKRRIFDIQNAIRNL